MVTKMEWSKFHGIMNLRNSGRVEDALRESQRLLSEVTEDDEKASLLQNMVICCLLLGRFAEARHFLDQLNQVAISDLEVRLNAEFCEPRLLVEEGDLENGVRKFAAMLRKNSELSNCEHFRYLYEDVQYRRALALVGLSRFAEAIPLLEEAVASFAFAKALDIQQAHFALGICYYETNAEDFALQEFLRVVNFDLRTDIEERARYRLAIIYFNSQAFAQAKHHLEMILQNHSIQGFVVPRKYVLEQLAHTYRHLGDDAKADLYADLAKRA